MFSRPFQNAITTEVFKDGGSDSLHDVVFDVVGTSYNRLQLQGLFGNLPEDIQCDALKWGLSDTEVRESIYVFLEKKAKDNE